MSQLIYREAVFSLQPNVAEGYVGSRVFIGDATLTGLRVIVYRFPG